MEAEAVLALCDRFKCLPSALLQEDVTLLRYLKLEELTRGGEEDGE